MTDTPHTRCHSCVFADISTSEDKQKHQSGCSLNRHDLLGVDSIDENNSFILKRVCNTFRPSEWVENLPLEEALKSEEAVLKEVYPRMGFFIRLNTESASAIEELDKTINSIAGIVGGPAYVAVVTDKVEYNEEIWGLFLKHFGEGSELEPSEVIKYHIVQLESNPDKLMRIVDECFTHAQNGWIYTVTSGNNVPSNILDRIHDYINIKMKRLIMIEPNQEFDGLVFPAFLFKFLNGNKQKMFDEDNIDTRDFISKVKDAEKRSETKSVLTWEEFNAA